MSDMPIADEFSIAESRRGDVNLHSMQVLIRFFVLAVFCTLTGCVRFHPRPVSPVSSITDFEAQNLTDQGLKAFIETNLHSGSITWPLPEWDFTHLTLAAYYYSPDLDVARAKWAVSRAGKITAGERPNPTISVMPMYSTSLSVPSPWLVTPTLDIPIETAGKRGYRIAQATQLSESARLNLAMTAWQVRGRVRRSLLDLYSAIQTQELLKAQQGTLDENLRLLQGQYDAGAVSAFELTQARLAGVTARLALRDAEAQSADARAQLADNIGVPVKALDAVKLSFDSLGELPSAVPISEARRQALLNRADILSALSDYAASQAALQLEIAKQYPDIHLNPGYEYDQGNNKWGLGLTVTLPVLSRNKGPIAEALAQREAAAATFVALQAHVVAEIDRAVAAYEVAQKKRDDAESLVSDMRKQQRTYEGMFEAGEISKSELSAQELQLSTTALARLDALVKSQLALGQLEDALQSPLGISPSAWQVAPRISRDKGSNQHP